MAKGKKLDLDLSASWDDGWSVDRSTAKKVLKLIPQNEHQLFMNIEKRRGKNVTIVGRFLIDEKVKKELLKTLKSKLSCGGKVADDLLELQGDHRERLKELLPSLGWKLK
jgi:translation initiation factor 1